MTKSDYRRHTDEWFKGRKARTLTKIESQRQNIKAGRVVTIVRKRGGFTIHTPACVHCGVGLEINRVSPHNLELIDKD